MGRTPRCGWDDQTSELPFEARGRSTQEISTRINIRTRPLSRPQPHPLQASRRATGMRGVPPYRAHNPSPQGPTAVEVTHHESVCPLGHACAGPAACPRLYGHHGGLHCFAAESCTVHSGFKVKAFDGTTCAACKGTVKPAACLGKVPRRSGIACQIKERL